MAKFTGLLLSLLLLANANANAETLKDVQATRTEHSVTKSIKSSEYKFTNGLTVFLTENPKAPNVRVSHWVKAGSLHEKPGSTGIAHLFEHMMFRPLKPGAPTFFEL